MFVEYYVVDYGWQCKKRGLITWFWQMLIQ